MLHWLRGLQLQQGRNSSNKRPVRHTLQHTSGPLLDRCRLQQKQLLVLVLVLVLMLWLLRLSPHPHPLLLHLPHHEPGCGTRFYWWARRNTQADDDLFFASFVTAFIFPALNSTRQNTFR